MTIQSYKLKFELMTKLLPVLETLKNKILNISIPQLTIIEKMKQHLFQAVFLLQHSKSQLINGKIDGINKAALQLITNSLVRLKIRLESLLMLLSSKKLKPHLENLLIEIKSFLDFINKLSFSETSSTSTSEKPLPKLIQPANTIDGLELKPVAGDGSCFYHAVALHVQQNPVELRNLVADYLTEHLEEYRNHIVLDEQYPTYQAVIQGIRSGAWADNLESFILMRVLNRPIVIIGPDGVIRNQHDIDNEQNGSPIFIYYNGINHYNGYTIKDNFNSQDILNRLIFDNSIINEPNDEEFNPDKWSENINNELKKFLVILDKKAKKYASRRNIPDSRNTRKKVIQILEEAEQFKDALLEVQNKHNVTDNYFNFANFNNISAHHLKNINQQDRYYANEYAHWIRNFKEYLEKHDFFADIRRKCVHIIVLKKWMDTLTKYSQQLKDYDANTRFVENMNNLDNHYKFLNSQKSGFLQQSFQTIQFDELSKTINEYEYTKPSDISLQAFVDAKLAELRNNIQSTETKITKNYPIMERLSMLALQSITSQPIYALTGTIFKSSLNQINRIQQLQGDDDDFTPMEIVAWKNITSMIGMFLSYGAAGLWSNFFSAPNQTAFDFGSRMLTSQWFFLKQFSRIANFALYPLAVLKYGFRNASKASFVQNDEKNSCQRQSGFYFTNLILSTAIASGFAARTLTALVVSTFINRYTSQWMSSQLTKNVKDPHMKNTVHQSVSMMNHSTIFAVCYMLSHKGFSYIPGYESAQSRSDCPGMTLEEAEEIFGMSRNAGSDELNRKFRRLSLLFHPDKAGQQGTDQFHRLTEAQNVFECHGFVE